MKCFPSKAKHFVLARAEVKAETEEQQKLKNEKHGACYAVPSMHKH